MENPSNVLAVSRKQAGITQMQLAAKLGISQGYLCDIEVGRRQVPEKWAVRLPDDIRKPVIKAMIKELRSTIKRLRTAL